MDFSCILVKSLRKTASVLEILVAFWKQLLDDEIEQGLLESVGRDQLVVSIAAVCFFTFANAAGLLRSIKFDPYAPTFLEERNRHIASLVVRGALAQAEKATVLKVKRSEDE